MTRRPIHSRPGFSVIELIVTIGAIALITVGVAKIFQSVGETVSGGRRVSGFTQAAATLESQIRLDVQSLTRDGFLLIHNQQTASGVPLAPGVTGPRQRRIDELMFFARGDFTSRRPPVRPPNQPFRVAQSSEARIYYGHGQRIDPFNEPNRYLYPAPFDGNFRNTAGTSSLLGAAGGPNEYASDWVLVREVSLLVEPKSQSTSLNAAANFATVPTPYRDNEYQIAFQPAMGSLFKALAHRGGNDLTSAEMPITFYDNNGNGVIDPGDQMRLDQRPAVASGIVDIITTSLAEIRAIIMDVGGQDNSGFDSGSDGHPRSIVGGDDSRPLSSADLSLTINPADDDASDVLLDGGFERWASNGNPGDLPYMHAWMRDAMPAYSSTLQGDIDAGMPTGQRVRSEPLPPDLVETAFATTGGANAYFFADQIALSGNELLPRCTEFIVEWSFGEVYQTGSNAGRVIWHGGNGPGSFAPYNGGLTGDPQVTHYVTYTQADGTTASRAVLQQLIHDAESNSGANRNELYSYFGWIDPTYAPASANDPATLPWPWPKMLRITATFADAADPSIEQSTQFIVEVPQQ